MSDLVLVSLITATAAIGGPVVMHVISQRAARTEAQRLTSRDHETEKRHAVLTYLSEADRALALVNGSIAQSKLLTSASEQARLLLASQTSLEFWFDAPTYGRMSPFIDIVAISINSRLVGVGEHRARALEGLKDRGVNDAEDVKRERADFLAAAREAIGIKE